MSTKLAEQCPVCGVQAVEPTDTAVPVDSEYGTFPVKFWRYVCGCGWRWANVLQRQHNEQAYRRAWREAREERGYSRY